MKSNIEIAKEVVAGLWGNGGERRKKITESGYNYDDIQSIVNALISDKPIPEGEKNPELVITGTEIMEIELNLNKYKGVKLIFKVE